ncbi:MAG: DNA mismatch repair protein MutS, partial [Clostridiales bacterium]|nr:DNA mismatch repair protein MutS [Clostridiales bacterium]
LFATHYHELTELEGKLEGVNNYCIAVKEQGDDIIFLRKIVKGGADKSYGIQVAKLAGVPVSVIKRSNEIVDELIGNDLAMKTKDISTTVEQTSKDLIQDTSPLEQYSMFSLTGNDDIINEIREMDLSRLTPIDAINKLYQMQNKIKDRI